MDDIQRPPSLPGRHRIALDDLLHAQDQVRIGAVQQSEPFMTVGVPAAELVLIGITLGRDQMVDQLRPRPPPPCPGLGRLLQQKVNVASAGPAVAWFARFCMTLDRSLVLERVICATPREVPTNTSTAMLFGARPRIATGNTIQHLEIAS